VAEYWRQHYDLEAKLERDWMKLGPELAGKIHIYVGSDDTYFLNDLCESPAPPATRPLP